MCFLDQGGGVEGPGEVFGDVDPQELEAGNTLYFHLVDVEGGVCATLGLPEVHDDLLGILGVEGQVVGGAPRS